MLEAVVKYFTLLQGPLNIKPYFSDLNLNHRRLNFMITLLIINQ